MTLSVSPITDPDVEPVITLWQRCGLTRPWNDPGSDIAFARRGDNATILVGRHEGKLIASAMVGHDGHRGWVYYLATSPTRQRQGLGRRLMSAAEEWLRARGVRKCELMIRSSNEAVAEFYGRLGYEREPVRVMSRWLDGTQR